jgi:hypothetical protein
MVTSPKGLNLNIMEKRKIPLSGTDRDSVMFKHEASHYIIWATDLEDRQRGVGL